MGEIEGSYRILQTPGTRLGAQFNAGISTLEPGQGLNTNVVVTKGPGRGLQVRVQGLDESLEFFDLDPRALGQDLLSEVFLRGNLIESDYFGLEFQNMQMNWLWLEPTKLIVKQIRRPANSLFRLAVKFFPPDPGQLQEEFTRYLFSLQMKRDLMEGRLICTENTGALLASHLVQSEIGDYDAAADQDFLMNNKLLPYQEKVLEAIVDYHRRHFGQTPAESDFQILEIARKLEMYGVRFHPAADREGTKINLAVAHMGLQVFQGHTKINTFNWSKIRKLSFKRKRFLIKLHPEVHGPHQDTLEFMMGSRDQCKVFWKICVEYHSFFRLFDQPQPKPKTLLFTRGSSFRYSGRTQKQLVEYARENGAKRTPYQRRNSKIQTSSRSLTIDVPKQSFSFNERLRTPCSPPSSYHPTHIAVSPRKDHPALNHHHHQQQSPSPAMQPMPESPQKQQQQPQPHIPSKEEAVNGGNPPTPYTFPGAPTTAHFSPAFVCAEGGTLQAPENVDSKHVGRRAAKKGVLTPEAFEAELMRTKQKYPLLRVTEEFIDDDPTQMSFFGGSVEAYPYGRNDAPEQFDYEHGSAKNGLLDTSVEDLNGSVHPFPDSVLGHSETSSLLNNRSECSSLDNLGLSSAGESMSVAPDSASSLRLPGSDVQSEASSMVNFPASSVRSESSSAIQFSDLVEQLEQLSYPPTATEGSENDSSDSDWGLDSVLPPEQNLFYSNPLTGNAEIESFLLHCQNLQALALADPPGPGILVLIPVGPVWNGPVWTPDIEPVPDVTDMALDSPQLSPFDVAGPFCLSPSFQMSTLSLPGQAAATAPSPLQSPVLSEVGSNARVEEEEEGRRKRYPADKAYFIAKEILTTERTYLKDLEVITVWFRSAVIKENAMPDGLMTLLFSNIDPIYEFHRGFLKELDQRLALWEGRSNAHVKGDYQRIGDVMLKNMSALKGFTSYLQKHDEVLTELEKASKRLKKLETVYKEFELQKVCYLPLNTFLLKPIQRLMHYKLILERLCKHYGSAHRHHTDCKEALKEVAEIAAQLQSSLIRLENFQKLTELQRDLIGIDNLTTPGREFIREGCLYKLTKKGLQQRMFFLFTDMLLYTSKGVTATNQFKVHGQLPLHGMILIILDAPVEESEKEWAVPHCFTIYSAHRTIVVAASSKLEMNKWIEDLNMAIDLAKKSQEKSSVFLDGGLADHSNRSSDEVSLEQESEDDMNSSRTSLEKQAHHRANTTMHVCWHRNTSVSMSDHSLAVEVLPSDSDCLACTSFSSPAASPELPPRYLLGQGQRPNTITHVCWYRNQNLSLTDYLRMNQNQLSGYLLRKFKNSNGWQKLWVVFTNFCLFFYKTHQDDFPLASLPLLGYTVSTPEEADAIHKDYVFKLQFKSHVYFFRAESEYTFERWMEVIKSAATATGRVNLLVPSKGGGPPAEINIR
nr:FERM, ARHGEF and pleckstrin domain-containing protein 2-like [Nerophis lumbriciformis]